MEWRSVLKDDQSLFTLRIPNFLIFFCLFIFFDRIHICAADIEKRESLPFKISSGWVLTEDYLDPSSSENTPSSPCENQRCNIILQELESLICQNARLKAEEKEISFIEDSFKKKELENPAPSYLRQEDSEQTRREDESYENEIAQIRDQIYKEAKLCQGKLSQSLSDFIENQNLFSFQNRETIYSFLANSTSSIELKIDGNLELIRERVIGINETQSEFLIQKMLNSEELGEFYRKAFFLISSTGLAPEILQPVIHEFYAKELSITLLQLCDFNENEKADDNLDIWKIKTDIIRLNFLEFTKSFCKTDEKTQTLIYAVLEKALLDFYEKSVEFLKQRYHTQRNIFSQTVQVYGGTPSRTKKFYELFKDQFLKSFNFIKKDSTVYKKIEMLDISCEKAFKEQDEKAAKRPGELISTVSTSVSTTATGLMKGALKLWNWK